MHTNYPRYNIVIKLFPLFLKNQIYTVISEKEINFFKNKQNRESCMVSWRESLWGRGNFQSAQNNRQNS